jgi:hypothetical protein
MWADEEGITQVVGSDDGEEARRGSMRVRMPDAMILWEENEVKECMAWARCPMARMVTSMIECISINS